MFFSKMHNDSHTLQYSRVLKCFFMIAKMGENLYNECVIGNTNSMRRIVKDIVAHKRFYGVLCLVFVCAAVVRLWGLGAVPFVADEFLDVNATYGYHKTGQWQAWDFNHDAVSVRDNAASDKRAWLYRAQVAFLYQYLPPTETTVRLVSALWGIVMTLLLYAVTLSLTKNRWIALIAAFLWAVSVPAIEINRKVRMYSMFAPVFLLFWWSVFQFIEARRDAIDRVCRKARENNTWKDAINCVSTIVCWWYLVPVVCFGAVSYHLHPLTGNIVLVVFVYCVVMAWVAREARMKKRYGIYSVLMLCGAVCAWWFVPHVWVQFTSALVFFENHWSYVGHILRGYWHPLIGVALILLGAWHMTKAKHNRHAGMWVVSSFFTILCAAIFLWRRNVGPQYIFFIQSFGCMLAGAGVYALANFVKKHVPHRNAFLFALLTGVIFVPFYGYFFLENNTYHITSRGEQPHYRKVFDYVKRHTERGDVMITRNFRNYYWSGLDIPVYDFGTERSAQEIQKEGKVQKITVAHIEGIVTTHPQGWIVFTDNDTVFITKEARAYCDAHFTRITDSPLVRGKVFVYRWDLE